MTEAALADEPVGLLITADQERFNEMQVAALRQLGVEDAPQGDLDLFFHVCKRTNLDPFRKQIFMIGRNTKVTNYVPNADGDGQRKVERYVTKYTIQTGIKGYRKHAREIANLMGVELSFDGPYWCGEDGAWREVWPETKAPTAAKFVVFRDGVPYSAVVHYSEYVQTIDLYEGSGNNRRKTGTQPNSMWDKMPRNQLAKCAEAAAYERAFPDDFDGLVLDVAAQPTIIDGELADAGSDVRPSTGQRPRGLAGAKAAINARRPQPRVIIEQEPEKVPVPAAGADEPAEPQAEPAAEPASAPDADAQAAPPKLRNQVLKLLAAETFTNPKAPETLEYVSQLIEAPITDLNALTQGQAEAVIAELSKK